MFRTILQIYACKDCGFVGGIVFHAPKYRSF